MFPRRSTPVRSVLAVDLRASYRGENTLFWNASVGSPPERLRGDLALLAELAESGLVTAGKDISNGGILQKGVNTLRVTVAGVGGLLTGWMDFNADGHFDESERLSWTGSSDVGKAPPTWQDSDDMVRIAVD